MPDLGFVRAHDLNLSLWQSLVADYVRSVLGDRSSTADVLQHPMMRATNVHVAAVLADPQAIATEPTPGDEHQAAAYLSRLGLEKGMAMVDGDTERVAALDLEFRRYSNIDPGFFELAIVFVDYYFKHDGQLLYNDWKKQGKEQASYGVIDWKLPNDALVGIIGDWGTGLDDARELLKDLMKRGPAAIIHLGDIYYSGLASECEANFTKIIAEVFKETLPDGERIPVFTLAGNHDYYAFGYGFYPMLKSINSGLPRTEQVASYFCLRTEDGAWQFLAMDTGYGDASPIDLIDPGEVGPELHFSEKEWLCLQLEQFNGATVMLSHNQLFSAHDTLNTGATPYLNTYLHTAFQPYFASDIAAWLWGHEHNFAMYQEGLFGLSKGRLVGCSAYEELVSADPYGVKYKQVPYLDPSKYQLQARGDYYDHGYAVVDLKRAQLSDPVKIHYYGFPSWGYKRPSSLESTLICCEELVRPTAASSG
ncbi:MAG: metallophosphoesterase [Solirubrobacteraceae bacterium]|jgi:hypothetical protein